MTEARFNYTKNASFPFKFIANNDDVGQGHGKPRRYSNKDEVMVATMAAMKMQLLPETLILNSCSNFHKLIESFSLDAEEMKMDIVSIFYRMITTSSG
jgi:hypothetical protein